MAAGLGIGSYPSRIIFPRSYRLIGYPAAAVSVPPKHDVCRPGSGRVDTKAGGGEWIPPNVGDCSIRVSRPSPARPLDSQSSRRSGTAGNSRAGRAVPCRAGLISWRRRCRGGPSRPGSWPASPPSPARRGWAWRTCAPLPPPHHTHSQLKSPQQHKP